MFDKLDNCPDRLKAFCERYPNKPRDIWELQQGNLGNHGQSKGANWQHGTFYPPYLSSFSCVGFLARRKVLMAMGIQ